MIYKIFWRSWFWLTQYFNEHPDWFFVPSDWPCQCGLCLEYSIEDREEK